MLQDSIAFAQAAVEVTHPTAIFAGEKLNDVSFTVLTETSIREILCRRSVRWESGKFAKREHFLILADFGERPLRVSSRHSTLDQASGRFRPKAAVRS